jgi:CubicO group peptidase (beta-lactamase class C family)
MKPKNALPLLLVGMILCPLLANAEDTAHADLPRSVPEAEGVASPGILDFLQAIDYSSHELHSFMLVRHGKVVAEAWWNPYRPELKHTMYSVSKSFTSTAIGFAVSEKRLRVGDKVISFFPQYAPASTGSYLSELTVKDLLTMSVGQDPDPTGKIWETAGWEKAFLETPIVNKPGSRFLYNSMGTYMLSAIVTKVTGQKVSDYLKPRLLDPLGITDYDWETSPTGSSTGGWGLRLRTEDMAKFGQVLLNKGLWNGRQVLSTGWIEEATSRQILQSPDAAQEQRDKSDWLQGYGYQFWRCRHNAFRADGAFGQYIIIMPEPDAVIAITSQTNDMQGVLNLIWEHLLPALQESKLPTNEAGVAALQHKLTGLAIPVPSRGVASPLESTVSGRTYLIAANDKNLKNVSFKFNEGRCEATFEYDNATHLIPMGAGAWVLSETARPGPNFVAGAKDTLKGLPPFKIAAAYGWKDNNTLELTLRYIESPHTETILATFDGEHLVLTYMSPHLRQSSFTLSGKLKR